MKNINIKLFLLMIVDAIFKIVVKATFIYMALLGGWVVACYHPTGSKQEQTGIQQVWVVDLVHHPTGSKPNSCCIPVGLWVFV
jgi:hypothetical protein